jgi:hypothetical protein
MQAVRIGRWVWLGAAAPALLLVAMPAASQLTFNEREVKSVPSKLDKADVWAFDFRFKDPRMIKVNIPARGTRICWYMWYQVINRTGESRDFFPTFELVTSDPPAVYIDEYLPAAEAAIKRIEDPAGIQDIKSFTVTGTKVPASKPADEAFPRAVTGVAIWVASAAEPAKKAERNEPDLSEAARFSIYVRGLSNGYVVVDPPAPGLPPITRYKTLQLNFKRVGDRFSVDSRDVTFVAPAEWIYRAGTKATLMPLDRTPSKMK